MIRGISSVLQKLLKYFKETTISTFFVPWLPVWRIIFSLNLNKKLLLLSEGKSIIATTLFKTGSSLQYFHKLLHVLYYIKFINITTSMSLALFICVLFILLMESVNGTQVLNKFFIDIICTNSPVFGTVIVSLTSIYATTLITKI